MKKDEMENYIDDLKGELQSARDDYKVLSHRIDELNKYKDAFERNNRIINDVISGSECAFEIIFSENYQPEDICAPIRVPSDTDGSRYNQWVLNNLRRVEYEPLEEDRNSMMSSLRGYR